MDLGLTLVLALLLGLCSISLGYVVNVQKCGGHILDVTASVRSNTWPTSMSKYRWGLEPADITKRRKLLQGSYMSAVGENNEMNDNGIIDLLFDGECPICMMEVEFLKKRDVKERIRFTDLRDPDYNPADHGNVSFEDGMRKLRAVLPDGSVVMGVEVFRRTYKAIGLGWIFELTNLPVIGKLADSVYDVWAENRLRLTGRGELADILVARAKELKEMEPLDDCDDECGVDYDQMP